MTEPTVSIDDATIVWTAVETQLDEFCQAWGKATEPPDIADHLGDHPISLKRLILLELIKVDIEQRWANRDWVQSIEWYLATWPELNDLSGVPAELLYEDVFHRRANGEDVDLADYAKRFPKSASALNRLLGTGEIDASTCMNHGRIAPNQFRVGDTVDDFELRTELGRGAFGVVFLAIQKSMQRMVALKISANRGTEAQVLAQLEHAHIVRVYDRRVLEGEDVQLFYMQYVRGGTLHGALKYVHAHERSEWNGKLLLEAIDKTVDQHGEVQPAPTPARFALSQSDWLRATCDMGIQLASALDYAHQKETLHRDIKPANILLTVDGVAKLADFNISCNSKVEGASPAAYFGGSLGYMSPEQLEAYDPRNARTPDSLDGRTDIYSEAVVIWEMLTGSRPFGDEKLGVTWEKTLEELIERRRAGLTETHWANLPRNCPSALRKYFQRALDPNPENRFESASDAIRLLRLASSDGSEQTNERGGFLIPYARRYPWTAFLLALIPNLLAAVFVYFYNGVQGFQVDSPERLAFDRAAMLINGIFFPLGVLVVILFSWPLGRALRSRRSGSLVSADLQVKARNRSLNLGRLVLMLGIILWTIAGIVYPIFLYRHLANTGLSDFFYSHALGGLIAGTYSFFLITFIGLTAWYPPFLETGVDDDGTELKLLQSTSKTVGLVEMLAASLPMLGIALMVFAPGSEANRQDHQRLLSIMSIISLFGYGLSHWCSRAIQRRLERLKSVLIPVETLTRRV